ncbi:hypothetical protein CHH28_09810 [Bacterioplanes sanyensis]|uniref:Histidine phosphatase family protein n=1 Tax=Bacterioplanes sanyensis TaxID=1249553 RepID=A0A222FIZ4_9GAMM|nr:histidine phosphatase family protein [Bacterioplanes sanyensis]ASP38958.1 hypothetical protein CHH28_09810 [Bacterioplanes sanyensis]
MSAKTQVHFLRHGEPIGGDIFRGSTDVALSEHGRWQFNQRVRRCLVNAQLQGVISSPLQRCLASADELANQFDLDCDVQSAWREIDYGDWENRLVRDVLAESPKQVKQMSEQPLAFCAPNGEHVAEFQARLIAAWQQLLARWRGAEVVVVCHGGVMRVLAQHLLGLEPAAMNRLSIPYAGWMHFCVHHGADQAGSAKNWVSLQAMDGSELVNTQLSAEVAIGR